MYLLCANFIIFVFLSHDESLFQDIIDIYLTEVIRGHLHMFVPVQKVNIDVAKC